MKNRWAPWAGMVLLWSALGVLFALPGLSSGNWNRMLVSSLAQWWSWGLVTPLILWLDGRLPMGENRLASRILAHVPLSVVLTLVHFFLYAAIGTMLGTGMWRMLAQAHFLPAAALPGLLWSWLVYWMIFGVHQTFRYRQHYLASELRVERMERRLSEAHLNSLRMQLDPHFLFNALNTISAQVDRDPRLARNMIEHLGDLLRMSLDARHRQEIPLAEELAFLDHYVAIQKIRFAESLHLEIEVQPEVKYALVPCLIVQPLVENAIRHGISRRASGGKVTVSATRLGDQVELRVTDDGVGLPAGWTLETSPGMGLPVTRERVLGLHPDGASRFAVEPRNGGGTEVRILLPLRFAGKADHAAVR